MSDDPPKPAPGKELHALKHQGEAGRRKRKVEAKVVGSVFTGEMLAALGAKSDKKSQEDKD